MQGRSVVMATRINDQNLIKVCPGQCVAVKMSDETQRVQHGASRREPL